MKIGRNDPCPCGSGKKYKKCCMNKGIFEQTNRQTTQHERWTTKKVDQMSTEEILTKLQEIGIAIDERTFTQEIKTKKSSVALALQWEKMYKRNIDDPIIDFVYIAVGVLAKRLAPEHILIEQLNSMMQEGYFLYGQGKEKEACELWWEVWRKTLQWLAPREISSMEKLNQLTKPSMTQIYSNWVQDFETALSELGQKDEQFLEMLIQYTTEFREVFSQTNSNIMMNMGISAREAFFQLDRVKEGEELFTKLIEEKHDDPAWIYIRWGDLYTEWMNGGTIDHKKAESLYKKALELAKDEGDKEAILERINDLRGEE